MAKESKKEAKVVHYISILFSAAFLLMMMTYLMEQRQAAEALDGLRHSVSAMQSVDGLYEENSQLKEAISENTRALYETQQELLDLEEEREALAEAKEELERSAQAMDWFWQVNEAFVLGRYTLARNLIEELGELESYLPLESITDNGRFSPAHRYLEIKRELEQ